MIEYLSIVIRSRCHLYISYVVAYHNNTNSNNRNVYNNVKTGTMVGGEPENPSPFAGDNSNSGEEGSGD